MEIVTHDEGTELNKDTEPFLLEAIQGYISRSNFPRKLEVKRIKATKAYYDEKTKQHEKLIEKANKEVESIGGKAEEARYKCSELLSNLKQHIY